MKIHWPSFFKGAAVTIGAVGFGYLISSPKAKTQLVKAKKAVKGATTKKKQNLEPETNLAGN